MAAGGWAISSIDLSALEERYLYQPAHYGKSPCCSLQFSSLIRARIVFFSRIVSFDLDFLHFLSDIYEIMYVNICVFVFCREQGEHKSDTPGFRISKLLLRCE